MTIFLRRTGEFATLLDLVLAFICQIKWSSRYAVHSNTYFQHLPYLTDERFAAELCALLCSFMTLNDAGSIIAEWLLFCKLQLNYVSLKKAATDFLQGEKDKVSMCTSAILHKFRIDGWWWW